MTARGVIWTGVVILALAWAGPLPRMVPVSFAAHMTLHMLVVGIGVPLIAAGLAPQLRRRRMPILYPIIASMIDFAVIWVWHAPALHAASRASGMGLAMEQVSFASAALLVWLVALTAPPLAGALELFFTSMHMVLLGALMTLAPRALYTDLCGPGTLVDQQLGGVIMLTIGGVVYLGAGLMLTGRVLRRQVAA